MTRNELIQYIYDLGFVQNYSRKLAYSCDYDIIDDIEQELWVQICEVSDEKWERLLGQGTEKDSFKAVRGFIAGLIHRNIRSKNSKLYYKLKKHLEREIPMDDATRKIIEEIPDDESEGLF